MEAIGFVRLLKQSVVENDNVDYRELLDKTENATDRIWKEILPLYKNLTAEQKNYFLQFLRIIQINTVSSMLGILDGANYVVGMDRFDLRTQVDEEVINGDLQELFLTLVEEEKSNT